MSKPVQRRAPRLMNGGDGRSVVDPILGETHDLPTPAARLWQALHLGDAHAVQDALKFRPDPDARYVLTEQDEVIREHQFAPEKDDYEPVREPVPLEHCFNAGRPDLARLLLAAGANPDVFTVHGPRLVSMAARKDGVFLDLLIAAGARLDALDDRFGRPPLIEAVNALNLPGARALIAANAPVNLPTVLPPSARHGRYALLATPLAEVMKKLPDPCAEALFAELVQAGARLDRVDSMGSNALHHLAPKAPDWVDRLVAMGADPCGTDEEGLTPLHLLAQNQKGMTDDDVGQMLATAQALVRHGADLNAQDQQGYTPLLRALRHQVPLPVVRWMLDAGAHPDLGAPGSSPREDLLRRQLSWDEDSPGYVDDALKVFVAAEQQQLRAVATAATATGEATPSPARRRL